MATPSIFDATLSLKLSSSVTRLHRQAQHGFNKVCCYAVLPAATRFVATQYNRLQHGLLQRSTTGCNTFAAFLGTQKRFVAQMLQLG
jgi:hypothetical protein